MRVLRKDVGEGFLHLQLDSLDDLWAVRTLLSKGDLVTADTVRTAESPMDKLRDTKMEKRRMRLGVRVESVEWHDFDDHLRVLGPIETGPQDHGRHHTLVLRGDGMEVLVHKARPPLTGWQLRLLEGAVAATQVPQVVLLALDDSEAQFALLKSYGLQLLGSLPSGMTGKRYAGAAAAKQAFYEEALRSLQLFRPDTRTPLLVVGPGWWRDEFLAFVREKAPAAAAGAVTHGTAHGGRTGLQEAIASGLVSSVSREHRVEAEARLLDDLLARIAKGDRTAAYGVEEVRQAVDAGAADTVLASDAKVRAGELDGVLAAAEQARATVRILSTGHDAGSRLHQMGGCAALLRFPLPE